jgi:hypothetical protein
MSRINLLGISSRAVRDLLPEEHLSTDTKAVPAAINQFWPADGDRPATLSKSNLDRTSLHQYPATLAAKRSSALSTAKP